MRIRPAAAASLAVVALAAACAQPSATSSAQNLAEKVTRAVYDNDLDATVAKFDDATKKSITRSQLGLMSDKMHELGQIRTFTARNADPDRGRFDYDVAFTGGQLLVQMRLDPTGKVGGYYVVPEQATPSTASSQ